MPVRILHTGDMHLGRSFDNLGSFPQSRQQDLLDTFDRICTEAVNRNVAALLIAGDLFDQYDPPAAVVGRVQAGFERVSRAGIKIFAIPGNHDDVWYSRSIWHENPFPNATLFTRAEFVAAPRFTVDGVDVHVYGVAYSSTISPNPHAKLRPDGSGLHIAMAHATVDIPAHLPVEQRYYPLASKELAHTGMNYIALGHLHEYRQINCGSAAVACYPGSPEGLDPSEQGARYATLVTFDGGPPHIQPIPVNTRTVESARIDVTAATTEEIAEKIRAKGSRELLLTARLVGTPDVVPNEEALRARLANLFYWLNIIDETEMVGAHWVENIAQQPTIAGRFVRDLQDRIRLTQDSEKRANLELALKLGLVALKKRSAA